MEESTGAPSKAAVPATAVERPLESPASGPHEADQRQVQIQARVQMKARVLVRTDGLADDAVRAAHLEPIADIEAAVKRLLADDPAARICVLPQGPLTIAYVT